VVAADQLAVRRERDVALDDAGAHAGGGLVGLLRVLGELEGRAAVADREVGLPERPVLALLEAVLERAFVQALHEVERPRADLDRAVAVRAAVGGLVGARRSGGPGGPGGAGG